MPQTEVSIIEVQSDILKVSILTYSGTHADGIEDGEGEPDQEGGYIWNDAKRGNLWDDDGSWNRGWN